MNRPINEKDARTRATATIWGIAIGMFGICIPLTAITDSGIILPLLVLLGASGSTAAIWLAPQPRDHHLAQRMMALEERVINLETICSSVEIAARPPLPSLEPLPQRRPGED